MDSPPFLYEGNGAIDTYQLHMIDGKQMQARILAIYVRKTERPRTAVRRMHHIANGDVFNAREPIKQNRRRTLRDTQDEYLTIDHTATLQHKT